jgi:hypothetical protein
MLLQTPKRSGIHGRTWNSLFHLQSVGTWEMQSFHLGPCSMVIIVELVSVQLQYEKVVKKTLDEAVAAEAEAAKK